LHILDFAEATVLAALASSWVAKQMARKDRRPKDNAMYRAWVVCGAAQRPGCEVLVLHRAYRRGREAFLFRVARHVLPYFTPKVATRGVFALVETGKLREGEAFAVHAHALVQTRV
jgi:hypothetical protein